jgi:hypothetical protein
LSRLLALSLAIIAMATSTAAASASQAPVTHARQVISFFEHHPKAAATAKGQRVLFKAVHVLDSTMRSLQAAKAAASEFPPHHALWECIHGYEAGSWYDQNTGGNGHYGGLQMTWGWLGYVSGDPANLSQAQQEWAAEKAWAANGYSYGFLYGQWYEWDAADGCGTTG